MCLPGLFFLSFFSCLRLFFPDAVLQGFTPVADGEAEVFPDAAFVQDAVDGTFCPGGVLPGPDGLYLAVKPGFLHDGYGEVVPGADAFVCEVVQGFCACLDLRQQFYDGFSQVAGMGGAACLVGNDAEGVPFFAQPEHGVDEVPALGGMDPGGADDEGGPCLFQYRLFTGKFGPAIDGDGVGLVFRPVGVAGCAVEDVVGADVDDVFPVPGEVPCPEVVDGFCLHGFVFGPVDGGVGGAVDDGAYLVFGNVCLDRLFIGDVEFFTVGVEDACLIPQPFLEFGAQLAPCACYQEVHRQHCPFR